jgi:hypothetical protein
MNHNSLSGYCFQEYNVHECHICQAFELPKIRFLSAVDGVDVSGVFGKYTFVIIQADAADGASGLKLKSHINVLEVILPCMLHKAIEIS